MWHEDMWAWTLEEGKEKYSNKRDSNEATFLVDSTLHGIRVREIQMDNRGGLFKGKSRNDVPLASNFK